MLKAWARSRRQQSGVCTGSYRGDWGLGETRAGAAATTGETRGRCRAFKRDLGSTHFHAILATKDGGALAAVAHGRHTADRGASEQKPPQTVARRRVGEKKLGVVPSVASELLY